MADPKKAERPGSRSGHGDNTSGAAVTDRRFSTDRKVFYHSRPGSAGPLREMPDGFPSDPGLFPVLSASLGGSGRISDPDALAELAGAVVRRTASYPELSCGSVSYSRSGCGGSIVPVDPAAFTDAAALLVSALNSSSRSHSSEVAVSSGADGTEVSILTRDEKLAEDFARTECAGDLASLLPPCRERLSLAEYLCAFTGIRLSAAADERNGICGFVMAVSSGPDPTEFKNVCDGVEDRLLAELAAFVSRSDRP